MKKINYKNYQFLSKRNFIPFAHRGASFFEIENTHEAFKKALDLGFIHIETDARASKDGIPYLFHDRTLKRLTGDNVLFNKLSSNEIGKIRLRGSAIIPRLEETFEEFPTIFFNIDAKSWDVVGPLAETINNSQKWENICIGSFNDYRIMELRKLIFEPICYSTGMLRSFIILVSLSLGKIPLIKEPCIQLPLFFRGIKIINRNIVSKIKKSKTKLHIWGTNEKNHILDLIDYGVDGLMVDDCMLLKDILTERGLW